MHFPHGPIGAASTGTPRFPTAGPRGAKGTPPRRPGAPLPGPALQRQWEPQPQHAPCRNAQQQAQHGAEKQKFVEQPMPRISPLVPLHQPGLQPAMADGKGGHRCRCQPHRHPHPLPAGAVGLGRTVQQGGYLHPQGGCDGLQLVQVWVGHVPLPVRHRLPGDVQLLCQLVLGKALGHPKLLEISADGHGVPLLSCVQHSR